MILPRNWRYEQELASLLWKIDYRDIQVKFHASQYNTNIASIPVNRVSNIDREIPGLSGVIHQL